MRALLVALSGLVAPGFAQALMRERRALWIAFAANAVAWTLLAVTVWAFALVAVVFLATVVDAGMRYQRRRGKIRWSWADPLIAFGANVVLHTMLRLLVSEAFKAPSSSMNPTIELGDHFMVNKLAGAPSRGDIIVFQHPCEPQRDYLKRVIAVGGDTIEIRCAVVYLNGKAVPRELVDANCTYQDYDDFGSRAGQWVSRDCSRYRETLDGTSYEVFHEADLPARATWGDGDMKDFPQDLQPRSCAFQPDGEASSARNQPPGSVVETPTDGDPCKPHAHFVVPEGTVFTLGDNRANSNDSRYWGVVPVDNVRGRVIGTWLPLSRFGAVR